MRYTEDYLAEMDDNAAKAAEAYQDYVYQLKIFEGVCKDFLSALKMEIRKEIGDTSDAELETRARASNRWKEFRHEQFKALKEAGRRSVRWENAQRRWETARSGLSLRREEVKRNL